MAVRKTDKGYKAEVFLGIDPATNKKIRKTKTFKLQKEAKDWEIKILRDYKTGELNINADMSLKTYLEYWYETYAVPNTKYTTHRRYRTLIDKINLSIGHIALNKVKTPIIDKFYADLKKELNKKGKDKGKRRYSDSTVLKFHKLLVQAFEKAIGWDILIKNPAKYATAPKSDTKEITVWSLDQVNYFLNSIKGVEVYNIYYPVLIAFHTGLRAGEIAALKWDNVNLKEGYLDVKLNAVEKKGEGITFTTPKTESSSARVMLTNELIKELKELKKKHKIHKLESGIDLDFVCTKLDGKSYRPTYFSKAFKYQVERLEMPYLTFHGLRHTHASILFELGASSQEISKRLRHSRVSTTDDIYIHLKEDTKKSTADLFNQAVENHK